MRLAVLLIVALVAAGCRADPPYEFACTGDNVAAWGDSLTWSATKTDHGYQQARPTWVETLGEDLKVETRNFGEPTQGSAEVAVRQGGLQPLITVEGDRIPAGNQSVPITTITPSDGWTQYADAGTMRMRGTLAGTPGTLEHTVKDGVESFAFTLSEHRDEPIPVAAGTPFIGTQGYRYRECVQLIWVGTNNPRQSEAIERDIASMVGWMSEPKRFLVIGTVESTHAKLAETYKDRYVDLRSWLIRDGAAAVGLPTRPGDSIPSGLTSDGTHFTPAAYTAIGHHIAQILRQQLR